MDKRIKTILAAVLCAATMLSLVPLFLFAFEDSNTVTEFYWTPAISAHEDHPAELLLGTFEDASGNQIDLRAGKPINSGWGSATGLADIGPANKPLPISLDLQYFSYVENLFYGRKLDLPIAQLKMLFETGFANQETGERGQYDSIIVGLGAGGNVSLWVAGGRHVHEVATFQVPQLDIAWADFQPSSQFPRPEFIEMVMADLEYDGEAQSTLAQFAKLERQYPWIFKIISDGPVGELRLAYLNGERDFFNMMRPLSIRETLGMPERIRLTWSGTDGGKFVGNVTFDTAETLKAYEAFSASAAGTLRLELRIADTNRNMLLTLRDDQQFYEFQKTVTQVFKRKK